MAICARSAETLSPTRKDSDSRRGRACRGHGGIASFAHGRCSISPFARLSRPNCNGHLAPSPPGGLSCRSRHASAHCSASPLRLRRSRSPLALRAATPSKRTTPCRRTVWMRLCPHPSSRGRAVVRLPSMRRLARRSRPASRRWRAPSPESCWLRDRCWSGSRSLGVATSARRAERARCGAAGNARCRMRTATRSLRSRLLQRRIAR